ncbi:MAG: 3'-5' exoribonuclease [Fibrobacter sp.]|nr:3'-5' exoribonuclease [Fibrobacter sp.]
MDNVNLNNNVMVDIETLGTAPGSVITEIGACGIDSNGEYHEFSCRILINDSIKNGFTMDADTIKWWFKQGDEARKSLADESDAITVDVALDSLVKFFDLFDKDFRIWCQGSSFDFALIGCYFKRLGRSVPWKFWNERDLRTLKAIHPYAEKIKFEGIKHTALSDAKNQFNQLQFIIKKIFA